MSIRLHGLVEAPKCQVAPDPLRVDRRSRVKYLLRRLVVTALHQVGGV